MITAKEVEYDEYGNEIVLSEEKISADGEALLAVCDKFWKAWGGNSVVVKHRSLE